MLDVDNDSKIIWPHIAAEKRFWVLHYAEEGEYKTIITNAERAVQEDYAQYPEDVLTVFTDTDTAVLFIASLGKVIGAAHNDNFRVLSMSMDQLMQCIIRLDNHYQSMQHAYLRVDICELRDGEYRRELLFSRQVPKH